MKQFNAIFTVFLLFTVFTFAQSKSLLFNSSGTDDIVTATDFSSLNQTYTIEGWIKPTSIPDGDECNLMSFYDGGSGDQFYLKYNADDGVGYLQANRSDGERSWTGLTTDTWYHVAYVRAPGELTVYLNGVKEIWGATDGTEDGAQTTLVLGHFRTDGNSYSTTAFFGYMDEVRVWSTARTSEQINDNKDKELSGSETGLFAYYNFNGESGTTLTDRTSGGRNGTLYNMDPSTAWVTDTAPLPVELTTFTAAYNGEAVTLNWETATEVNNYGFEIERKPESGDWSKIAFVEGHGNSNSPKYYTFTDREIPTGVLKYRLKQIDIDGTFEYSDVVEIITTVPKKYSLEANYPNPFNPTTNIRFSLPEAGFVKLEVFDVLGKEVKSLISKNMEAGVYNINFNGANLKSGIYVYKLQTDNFVQVRKMMLLK